MADEANILTKILIVSVWGSPKSWQLTRYVVELDLEIKELFKFTNLSEKEIKPLYQATKDYKSTLGALMECYKNASFLLLCSSTLADLPKKNYKEVVNEAKVKIEENLKDPNYCIDSSRVRIAILPGIGKFGDKVFKGTVNSYRLAAFLETLKHLKEINPEILILDLSHGVNYMPVYTRLAIEDAIISYLVLNKADNNLNTGSSDITSPISTKNTIGKEEKIRLLVYNSEPAPLHSKEGSSTTNITTINIVENTSIMYNFAIQTLYTKVASLGITQPVILKSTFGEKPPELEQWKNLWINSVKFAKAAIYGLVLPLAEYMERLTIVDIEKMENELRKFAYLDETEEFVRIKNKEVNYLFSPNINLGLIITIAKLAKRLREEKGSLIYEKGFNLEYLKRLGEVILYGPGEKIASREIGQLEQRVKLARSTNQDTKKWLSYSSYIQFGEQNIGPLTKLYEKRDKFKEMERSILENIKPLSEYETSDRKTTQLDDRNFVAHAGFERHVTLILDKGYEIFVKYDEDMKEKIENTLSNLLR